jgi:hypothetical protein
MADESQSPIFHVEARGGLASRMIQYMVAIKFQAGVPGCRIANVSLPEWGIAHPALPLSPPAEAPDQPHIIDEGLIERVRSNAVRCVIFIGYGHRMENFPALQTCRALFRTPAGTAARLEAQDLACPLGSGDAPEDSGPFYPLTPAEYYAEVAAETGLRPVFIGDAPAEYLDHLRARLPQAAFLDAGSPLLNFLTVLQAKSIVVGVSTFGWLAAWLSHAERIFMTVNGAFNPQQFGFINLLPFGDARYNFDLFPINYAVPIDHLATAHQRIAPFWRPVPHQVLERQIREAPRLDPSHDEISRHFDAAFYLSANPDVAELIGADNVEGAKAHYLLLGIKQHRLPFPLSPPWYAARYPMAGFEVGQGDHANFAHHYIAVGKERGYKPLPDGDEPWWD